jgi:hypothetical protein
MLSQTLSFSEKLRALKSFFINTYIKVLFCGQIKCRFLNPNQNLSPSARKPRHFLAIGQSHPSSARKKPEFLAAIKIRSPMARKTADFLAWSRL